MKFLIQKIDNKIVHDFSFTLLESIRYHNWLESDQNAHTVRYLDTIDDDDWFSQYHKDYIPVGSVEFVSAWFERFHNHTPKPINVPEELFEFAERKIFNGIHMDLEDLNGNYFVKSREKIKSFTEIVECSNKYLPNIKAGHYQISELIDIESEWRCFVYKGKLVGLQNYSGNFTMFPNIEQIKHMIEGYKSAPIAYTLDVGVFDEKTFIIEIHDFFSCGLYGFSNHKIYPHMLGRWFNEYRIKHKLV